MVTVWRICAAAYQDTAFSGIGGLYVSGRWHSQGHKIVYTAENLSLASLEVFVHLESDRIKLVGIKAELPDDLKIEEISPEFLSIDWQETTSYHKLQKIGKDWLLSRQSPVLKVPSAIVPVEYNYLLNPEHPDLKLKLDSPIDFKYDRRMWKQS